MENQNSYINLLLIFLQVIEFMFYHCHWFDYRFLARSQHFQLLMTLSIWSFPNYSFCSWPQNLLSVFEFSPPIKFSLLAITNMPPKDKGPEDIVNPLIYPPVDIHHVHMADRDYKIHKTLCELDLFEMYCWLKDKYIEKSDDPTVGVKPTPLHLSSHPQHSWFH